jgi:hypothetical protein
MPCKKPMMTAIVMTVYSMVSLIVGRPPWEGAG